MSPTDGQLPTFMNGAVTVAALERRRRSEPGHRVLRRAIRQAVRTQDVRGERAVVDGPAGARGQYA
jgi:hypothetical protein